MGCLKQINYLTESKPTLKVVWNRSNFEHPFGMLMPGRNWEAAGIEYRYGFQNQEVDNEVKGAGNSVNYKFRMHDPRLGRFFAVDPLASKYPYNSPYAFSENRVIDAVELEGLEAKLAISGQGEIDGSTAYTQSHIYAFEARALNLGKKGYSVSQVSSGLELLVTMISATKQEGSIKTIVIFAHGIPNGILLNNNAGFYKTGQSAGADEAREVVSLEFYIDFFGYSFIKFEPDATIVFGTCNAGRKNGVAEDITERTGVTTIAASGSVAPEYDESGNETGKLTTFKKHNEDPVAKFYKIEKVTTTTTISLFGEEFSFETTKTIKTDLGTTIDPAEYE